MRTVGDMLDYLKQFPPDWELYVTHSDWGGELLPYLEGEDFQGTEQNVIMLTTKE